MPADSQETTASLLPGELITDRHIASLDQDRLRHAPVADEIAQLATGVQMPCNIAVYAPWGAGKSGLARLIGERLSKTKADAEFVVFDASKYAGTSLRRHFISQVARSLKIKDKRFGSGLYRETTRTDVDFEARTALAVVGFLVLILLVAAAAAVGIAFIIALFAKGSTSHNFREFLRPALAFITAPAALALGIIAFAGKTIPVTRRISAPSSEEEFERLFRKLRKKVRAKRLVVFIDELDRCPAKDVVATLETVRTFLGVGRCVFIVAADQQVLERALRAESKQANPADRVNPYYSSGSEYLDKTFQHQLHLPPLRSRRLTQFALDLTAGLPGVWSQVDRSELIPVLVPTHVHSPRRVKALLNSYVTTYRLAQRRLGNIDPQTALQLAKLVCLRCEFPRFASDLTRSPELPESLLAAHQARQEDDADVDLQEVEDLAEEYASGNEPVDDLMLNGDDSNRTERQAVKRAHAEQLIAYLQKTEHVASPSRELIHLEASGALTGLESQIADRLEDFAANGQDRESAALILELASPDDQIAALRHLAQVTRELPPGPEGRNGVKCLLAALSQVPALDLGAHASEIAAAVSSHFGRYDLRREDLVGAFLLGMRTPLGGADELVSQVLERDELLTESDLAHAVIQDADKLLPSHSKRLGVLAAASALRSDDGIAAQLVALPDEGLRPLIGDMRMALPVLLDQSSEDAAADAANAGAESASWGEPGAASKVLGDLAGMLVEQDRASTARAALLALLELDTKEARDTASAVLPSLAPISDGALAVAILDAVPHRAVKGWPRWLEPLRQDIGDQSGVVERLTRLAVVLWQKATTGESRNEAEVRDAAVDMLARLGRHGGEELQTVAHDAMATPPQDDSSANDLMDALAAAEAFGRHELLNFTSLCPVAASALENTLAMGWSPQPAESNLVALVVRWLAVIARHLDGERRGALQAALSSCTWIPEAEKDAVQLDLAAVRVMAGDETACPLSTDQVIAYQEANPALFAGPTSAWIRHIATPEDAAKLLKTISRSVPDDLMTSLSERADRDQEWSWGVAAQLVQATAEYIPPPTLLRALPVLAASQLRAAQMLHARYEAANNNQERVAVLGTWRALGITDPGARKLLILNVMLPMAHSSKGGLEAVARYLDLASNPPYGTLTKLREDLLKRSKAADIEGQVRKAMENHGLIERKKGISGLLGLR